jgi:hypothetical protein
MSRELQPLVSDGILRVRRDPVQVVDRRTGESVASVNLPLIFEPTADAVGEGRRFAINSRACSMGSQQEWPEGSTAVNPLVQPSDPARFHTGD